MCRVCKQVWIQSPVLNSCFYYNLRSVLWKALKHFLLLLTKNCNVIISIKSIIKNMFNGKKNIQFEDVRKKKSPKWIALQWNFTIQCNALSHANTGQALQFILINHQNGVITVISFVAWLLGPHGLVCIISETAHLLEFPCIIVYRVYLEQWEEEKKI